MSAPGSPTPIAQLGTIPDGIEGVKATLRAMRGFVVASVRSQNQDVRNSALEIIKQAGVPNYPDPKNWYGTVKALHAYVRDQVRYVQDPEDVELIQTPEVTLDNLAGDCDDKSTLLAALLKAVGHPATFVAIGMNGEPFSHVLVETPVGDREVPLETILPVAPGWWPGGVTSQYRLKV